MNVLDVTFIGPCIVIYFYSKTNQMHQSITFILFWNDTLHVSEGLAVYHQEFKTVHTATGMCQTDTAVCLLTGMRWNCRRQYLFDICLLLYLQSRTPDNGRKDCPKHVECHSKIKSILYLGSSSWFSYGNMLALVKYVSSGKISTLYFRFVVLSLLVASEISRFSPFM